MTTLHKDVEQAVVKLEEAEQRAEDAGLDTVAMELGAARRAAIMAYEEIPTQAEEA